MSSRSVRPLAFEVSTQWQMLSTALSWGAMITDPVLLPPNEKRPDAPTRVVRSQHVVFLVGAYGWNQLRGEEVQLGQASLAHIGRTSYTLRAEWTANGSPVVATTRTVVGVDKSLGRAVPLPNADMLRSTVVASALGDYTHDKPTLGVKGSRPSDAFVWKSVTRWTECDQLGHMNQSQYGRLMEEARAVASSAAAYGRDIAEAAKAPPAAALLEYVGQALPGEALAVFTWWDGEAFRTDIERDCGAGVAGEILVSGRVWTTVAPVQSRL